MAALVLCPDDTLFRHMYLKYVDPRCLALIRRIFAVGAYPKLSTHQPRLCRINRLTGRHFAFPRADLCCGLSDGNAESSVTIELGDTDLGIRTLPVGVPCHRGLAHQIQTVHLVFEAALAGVFAPSPPWGTTRGKLMRSRLILGDGSRSYRLPQLSIRTRRENGMGIPRRNRVGALRFVVARPFILPSYSG